MDDEKFVEEKKGEFFLVCISLFNFLLLIPTVVDHFIEDKTIKERVITLEVKLGCLNERIDRLEEILYSK